jgi:hypothetical protein
MEACAIMGGRATVASMSFVVALATGCGDILPDTHPAQPPSSAAVPVSAYVDPPPGRVLRADAPIGFNPTMAMGVPLDGSFRAPAFAQKLFPYGRLAEVPAPAFTSDQKLVSTAEELAANAQAWGVLDVGASTSQHDRYAYFRAVQTTRAWELQANGPMVPPPSWAAYYVSKVYFGRSYVEIVKGDESSFNARVGAHFLTVPVGGSIKAFVASHRLTSHRAGVGFSPKGGDDKAIFARTEQEIEEAYVPGPEVPIAIEYTQLPRAQPNGVILFPEPRRVVVRFVSLHVGSTGSMMKNYSNWTMVGNCAVEGPPDTDLDEPTVSPKPFLQQRISAGGPWPVAFSRTLWATDEEAITCSTTGTYTRGLLGSSHALGPSTTSIRVGSLGASEATGSMSGRESETSYDVAWNAMRQ